MKRSIFFCLFALLQTWAYAQFKTIAEGPVFPEPEKGEARILQLKNGGTFFFHIPPSRSGIDIKLYDARHKQRASRHLSPRHEKGAAVAAIFETGGNAVVLLTNTEKRQPVLHRVVIDGTKGTIIEDKIIASLPRIKAGGNYAVAFSKMEAPGFFIQKDADSEYYAVAAFNSFESDRNKRVEIILYNGAHQEVSRAYYKSLEDRYKYVEYIDMAIVGETVHVIGYAFNTRASGGKENVLVMGTLKKGADAIDLTALEFAHDLEIDEGVLKYNPVSEKLMLLMYVMEKKSKGDTRLAIIDPVAAKVDEVKRLFPEEASAKSIELFGRKAEYEGRPVNFFVNPDGTFAVVYEEISTKSFSGQYSTRYFTYLHHLAVSQFEADGTLVKSYFIPKRQTMTALSAESFYHADREGNIALLSGGDQYKSFAYVNGKDKTYVLFNDLMKHDETIKKGKIASIVGVSECDAYYYTLSGPETIPARTLLYGKPARAKDHNLVLFAVSDYDREKNIYVTMRLQVQGDHKRVRLVWMEP